MSIRDMSKKVYLSSNDERTFDEDSNYSLYSCYEAGLNIQSFATKLGDLKRPFSLPYKSIRNSVNFSPFSCIYDHRFLDPKVCFRKEITIFPNL